jgi:hypothetical protein
VSEKTLSETQERADRIAKALRTGGVPAEIRRPGTDEEMQAARVEAIRRLGPLAQLGPTARHLNYWTTMAEHLRIQIADGGGDGIRLELSDALVQLGRLQEAADVAPERREMILRLADSLAKADDDFCDCEDYVVEVAHPTQTGLVRRKLMPRYVIDGRVYSLKHEALVWVTRCLRCGDTNATADPEPMLTNRIAARGEWAGPNVGSDYDILPDAPNA